VNSELSPSRFTQAMHHMKESLAWAQSFDDWVDNAIHSTGYTTPIPAPTLESLAKNTVLTPWFSCFQRQLFAYQTTLHQPLSIGQRIEQLLAILQEAFTPNALILTPVLAACEQPVSWLLRPGHAITRLENYTSDSALHIALGDGRRHLLSLPLKETGHALLQWSFPPEAEVITSVKESIIKTYWLPLLYAALTDDRLRSQINRHQTLYQVARMANTTNDKEELLDEYLRFMAPLLGAAHIATLFPASNDPNSRVQWEWMPFQYSQGCYTEPPRFADIHAEAVPESILAFLEQRVFFNPGIRQFTEQSELHYMIEANLPAGVTLGNIASRCFYTVAPFEMAGRSVEAGQTIQPFGLIFVHDQPWSNAQQALLAEANQWIWQAFQRSQEHERMLHLSNFDELTGLMNRRAMQARFIMEAERAVRNKQPLSIAVLDIDFFKQFNDQHGHLVGDNVLRVLSEHLATHVRRADVVCRFGGEEFVLLLPETSEDEAWELVDRLRDNVARTLKVPVVGMNGQETWKPVTFSGGVHQVNLAQVEGNLLSVLNANEWQIILNEALKKSDAALYIAKQEGRNKVFKAKGSPSL
jgi:diguanylate cyclase (GGDEF)-like protein